MDHSGQRAVVAVRSDRIPSWSWGLIPRHGRRHPPEREIDPPAFRQESRRAGYDPVDAVERQTRLAAEHDGIAGGEAHGAGRVAPLGPSNPKQASIAERERDHGSLEVVLVAVLMQAHLRR